MPSHILTIKDGEILAVSLIQGSEPSNGETVNGLTYVHLDIAGQ